MNEKKEYWHGWIVLAILVFSILLRAILVSRGGQYYWPDEKRYETSRLAAEFLLDGQLQQFLRVFDSAPHLLFMAIGVVPAAMEIFFGRDLKIPALFFSLFTTANLWLTWKIVLSLGGGRRAALFAVSLLSLCSTFLYYSRHLLPYDTAMTFGLLGLFIGLHKPSRPLNSILCGLFSALCFLTYNGCWILSGLAVLTHILQFYETLAGSAKRALLSGVSLAAPIVSLFPIENAEGVDFLSQFISFSGTVTQGVFSEGWSLPIAFLWHAEHLLIVLWAFALMFGLWGIAMGRRGKPVIFAVSAIVFIYATLVIFSVFLEKFVVYGRTVRQMVPFLSILAALFLDRLWTFPPQGKSLVIAILVFAVCQAALNFQQPLTQMFPREFNKLAKQAMVPTESGEYEILYAHHIYPEPQPATDSGRVILQSRNPLQYLPYQYEGYTPDQRSKLRSIDITMRLILKEP